MRSLSWKLHLPQNSWLRHNYASEHVRSYEKRLNYLSNLNIGESNHDLDIFIDSVNSKKMDKGRWRTRSSCCPSYVRTVFGMLFIRSSTLGMNLVKTTIHT